MILVMLCEGGVVFSSDSMAKASIQVQVQCKDDALQKERVPDDKIRHPIDGLQWRSIDREFPKFAKDARNIWFGLRTDGFNPFSEFISGHSTWLVTHVQPSSLDVYEAELFSVVNHFIRL
jgi:hypothetical protein